jgi:nucleoside-diphosphate-sugar epimerase
MKYLVLGSAGQIGGALVPYLEHQGHEVLGFDIVDSPQEDLRLIDNELLSDRMSHADFVMFLAFDVGGSRYLREYQHSFDFISNNARIMENTFSVLRRFKKPFLFASSQMSNMSYSPYGVLKAVGECYTKSLGGMTAKFWNVYGVEYDPQKSHVITDFIVKARDTGVIDMLTDGQEQRQFLYADDCSECLTLLSQNYDEVPHDRELHVASFEWHTILDVAKCVAELYPGTRITPGRRMDDVQKDKRNEPDPFILNYWKPQTSLKAGIRKVDEQMHALFQDGTIGMTARIVPTPPSRSAKAQVHEVTEDVTTEP